MFQVMTESRATLVIGQISDRHPRGNHGDYIHGSKLPTAFASGQGPDIFIISPADFLRYYNGGVLMDLTSYMEDTAKKDFFPNVMETRIVDEKIYGTPFDVVPLAMFYSLKAFEEAGLSESDIPKTWPRASRQSARSSRTWIIPTSPRCWTATSPRTACRTS